MKAFSGTAGGIGAATFVAAVLAAAPSAQAARRVRVVPVSCSTPALIAAINSGNVIPATLRLSPYCSYPLTARLPQITGTVALVGGPSTTLTAGTNIAFHILEVAATGHLDVRRIFIKNATGPTGSLGGAIENAGELVLNFVTLAGNTSNGASGGGLANLTGGRALIAKSLISGNQTNINGGAIYNAGTLTLLGSRLTANTAGSVGGAVRNTVGATLRVIQSTLDHNAAVGNGGAIETEGTASVTRSLIVRNHAGGGLGGGIFGTATINQSIIRNNTPDNCSPVNPAC